MLWRAIVEVNADRGSSHHERLTAATGTLGIWVLEHKFAAQLIVHPVHLGSYYAEQGLGVNHHLKAVLLNNLVKLLGLVNVL